MIPILLVLVGLLLAYEVVALYQNRGVTISETVWHVAYKYPLLPFAMGCLMGHFFWQSAKCVDLIK